MGRVEKRNRKRHRRETQVSSHCRARRIRFESRRFVVGEVCERMGEFTVYDRTSVDEIVSRAALADIVLTNKTPLSATTLEQLPHLRYIGVLATGYNIVDVEAANNSGIAVTNIPAYSSESVAQMVFAHLLNIASDVAAHSQCVKSGEWADCKDFTFQKSPDIRNCRKKYRYHRVR